MSSIKIELRQEDDNKIKEICASFNNDPLELINVHAPVPGTFRLLPAEVQDVISGKLFCSGGQDLRSGDILFIFHNDP